MNIKHYPELQEIEEHNNYLPSISIITPIHMLSEHEFLKRLKVKSDELERKLKASYNHELVQSMMHKLNDMITLLKIDKSKQGLVMYLSPYFKKVHFLDFEPEDKIVVDDSFEIRDLIYNKTIISKVILMLLSGSEIRYLLCDRQHIQKLYPDVPLHIEAFMQNTLHDVEIYYEKSERKEKAMHLFVKNADQGLGLLLKDHPYPVVVTGSEKIISEFKRISDHMDAVIEYMHGNYLESESSELTAIVRQALIKLQHEKNNKVLDLLKRSDKQNILAFGLKEVWKQVLLKNIDTLVVERNFRKPAAFNPGKNEIFTYALDHVPFPMHDAVDDAIERVILAGGKIEFVEDGALKDYLRIVLIKNHV